MWRRPVVTQLANKAVGHGTRDEGRLLQIFQRRRESFLDVKVGRNHPALWCSVQTVREPMSLGTKRAKSGR
jgi:hypothetical protein